MEGEVEPSTQWIAKQRAEEDQGSPLQGWQTLAGHAVAASLHQSEDQDRRDDEVEPARAEGLEKHVDTGVRRGHRGCGGQQAGQAGSNQGEQGGVHAAMNRLYSAAKVKSKNQG